MGDGARKAAAMAPRRKHAITLAAAALMLVGCASDPGPAAMSQAQLDDFGAQYDKGDMTVGDAVRIAPDAMVGMIDVRQTAGIGGTEEIVHGTPPAEFHDWSVVALCFYPQDVPSVEVAAVPPEDAQAFADGPGVNLVCDGPPEQQGHG